MKEQLNETFEGPDFFKAGNNALFIDGFVFGLSASLIWPLMFIVIGLGMIFVGN